MTRIDIITLFPELFNDFLRWGVCGRAIHDKKLLQVCFWNPRDFAPPPHRVVDDKPYGGGSGMVLKPEPIIAAVDAANAANPQARRIYLTPRGRLYHDQAARALAQAQGVIILCGRYRGIDERAVELFGGEEWSIGDYVLSGGEVAAMVVMEAMFRHVPEVLGNQDSRREEAFADGIFDAPVYTRPPEFAGKKVPPVLQTGDHAAIQAWRKTTAQQLTRARRPDLLKEDSKS